MIALRNTHKYLPFTATFYPEIAGKKTGDQLYEVKLIKSRKGKTISVKEPHSFQIQPQQVELVHDAAAHMPQVKAAIKQGWLVVVPQGTKAAPAKAEASAKIANGNGKGASKGEK